MSEVINPRLTPLPEFVLPGETEALAFAREAYANAALGGVAYYEWCGCPNCVTDLLDIDARSITLDLLVAQLHTPLRAAAAPAGGGS